eukprot:12833201-Alexandrium_andersonii.AAC.1
MRESPGETSTATGAREPRFCCSRAGGASIVSPAPLPACRSLDCAAPRATSTSTPQGLVGLVRHRFARRLRWWRRNRPAGAPEALLRGSGGAEPPR